MNEQRVADEFRRIELTTRPQRDREVIKQYETGLAYHLNRVELWNTSWGDSTRGQERTVTTDEYIATLNALMRADHEEYVAQVRGWAESADAEGRVAAARQHWGHVRTLEAMDKPWETKPRAA